MKTIFIELGKELDMLAKENPIFEKAINKLLYVSADEIIEDTGLTREEVEDLRETE